MKAWILSFMALMFLGLTACVHRNFEFIDELSDGVEVEIALLYPDTQLPLHTIVEYSKSRTSTECDEPLASRHIIKVYDSEGTEVASAVCTDEVVNATIMRACRFKLTAGEYTAVCWTDYADGAEIDRHYDTTLFPFVELFCETDNGIGIHKANTPWRDAFCGNRKFIIDREGNVVCHDSNCQEERPVRRVEVEMRRPMAHFTFEATDLTEFVGKERLKFSAPDMEIENINDLFADYRILFRYSDYMPSVFSARTTTPTDSRVGAAFWGEIQAFSTNNDSVEMGSDFVFVPETATSVKVVVEIYNVSTGERLSRSGPWTVPLLRNHHTIVRGRFLTANSGAGIFIDTDFAGDFNIKI